jgi:hypothetical protein
MCVLVVSWDEYTLFPTILPTPSKNKRRISLSQSGTKNEFSYQTHVKLTTKLPESKKFDIQNITHEADRQRHHPRSGRLWKLIGFLIGEYSSIDARAT